MIRKSFDIAGRTIGAGNPAYLIAEIAQAHDGSLGMAHSLIDAAKRAGADAVKFQTHIAAAESTRDEKLRVPLTSQDPTRYGYWQRMEFAADQWAELAAHALDAGLTFLSSPFSVEAVELLERLDVPAWKVGSGEIATPDLMAAMSATGKPILVSTGMASLDDIDAVAARVGASECPLALFQCTSAYPTPLESVGLNVIAELKARHGCPVGLSDHSGRTEPALAALARGADLFEAHLTFDRAMYGPDAKSSLLVDEFRRIRDFRDALSLMDANPVDKDDAAGRLAELRGMFSKSIAPSRDLAAGTVLAAGDLTLKKPGDGMAPERLESLVGRKLAKAVSAERLLREDDLEPDGS